MRVCFVSIHVSLSDTCQIAAQLTNKTHTLQIILRSADRVVNWIDILE